MSCVMQFFLNMEASFMYQFFLRQYLLLALKRFYYFGHLIIRET